MGNLKDFATSTVLTPPSPADSGTTIVVQSGHGTRFPAVPFMATIHPASELPTLDNAEKVEVTARTTDTLTVLRAQGSTTAKSIEAGWRISNAVFLADIPTVDSTSVDAAGATMNADTTLAGNGYFLDEDNMASDSAVKVASQQSIKAYIDASISTAKQALLPVGSIVVLGVSTNPATLYGFGTWTAIEGKVLVGKAAAGTFNTLDGTGGAETHTLTTAEMPSHTHTQNSHNHDHYQWLMNGAASSGAHYGFGYQSNTGSLNSKSSYTTSGEVQFGNAPTTATNQNTGGGGSHNNLQPYIVKYMWQRTA
jgi:microcystin-dependent protein